MAIITHKITIISLIIHNLLEGFMIIPMALNDIKTGILMTISIALHNIPLGTTIFSYIDIKHNKILISMLTLSSFLGGLIFLIFNNISNIILGIILALTIGMLMYIIFRELLPEIKNYKNKKEVFLGGGLGLLILVIAQLI